MQQPLVITRRTARLLSTLTAVGGLPWANTFTDNFSWAKSVILKGCQSDTFFLRPCHRRRPSEMSQHMGAPGAVYVVLCRQQSWPDLSVFTTTSLTGQNSSNLTRGGRTPEQPNELGGGHVPRWYSDYRLVHFFTANYLHGTQVHCSGCSLALCSFQWRLVGLGGRLPSMVTCLQQYASV